MSNINITVCVTPKDTGFFVTATAHNNDNSAMVTKTNFTKYRNGKSYKHAVQEVVKNALQMLL